MTASNCVTSIQFSKLIEESEQLGKSLANSFRIEIMPLPSFLVFVFSLRNVPPGKEAPIFYQLVETISGMIHLDSPLSCAA